MKSRKIKLKLVALIVVVIVGTLANLSYAEDRCPNFASKNGSCHKIGEYSLFMRLTGDKGPVIIFESGQGDTSATWNKVIPAVSQFARTVTYDRINLGHSQLSTLKILTAKQVVKNLHELLRSAKLKPPYFLVGHSAGGLFMQLYARLYPKEISGVIFVDSASPEQNLTNLPLKSSPVYPEAIGFPISQKQVLNAPSFPKVPIIVLTATYHGYEDPKATLHMLTTDWKPITMTEGQNQELWENWQNKIANLSKKSIHIYAYNSGHHIQQFQPKLVIDAIYTLIKEQKNK
jgi:pimeloyl-ACP methyl ester carboxylesterase